jgi:predicted ATP-dependent endonuclease of OLD family
LEPILSWHLQLEADDKEALADIPDSKHIERLVITLKADGSRTWRFEPRGPQRDRTSRQTVAILLADKRQVPQFETMNADLQSDFSFAEYDEIHSILTSDTNNFTDEQISKIRNLADSIRRVPLPLPNEESEEAAHREVLAEFQDLQKELANALEDIASKESEPSPRNKARSALLPHIPRIEFFEQVDRDLASEYDLTEVATAPPRALYHLASLAELDLKALLDEITDHRIADVATRRNAANRTLLTAFDQNWNQQGIAVQIDVQGTVLHIQATTPEDSGLSDIGERSDGMRWFAALLAFSHGWQDKPILLVDEIETHLHYDAQADLIGVLSRQQFTSKVIYTTHSFGCLPNDLGTGVRVVQPVDATTSRLENGFWKRGAGFSPLLASMGAAAMSFTPTRHAVIAEGAADAILLPTLLRQAAKIDRLQFQIAPGIAEVAASSVTDLQNEAGRVAFVVDGDTGGQAIVDKLTKGGISPEAIVRLQDADTGEFYETEDLVEPEIYTSALVDELKCWNEVNELPIASDLGNQFRTKRVEQWCQQRGVRAPDKAAVAQRIVDFSSDRPVFDEPKKEMIEHILGCIHSSLGIPAHLMNQ